MTTLVNFYEFAYVVFLYLKKQGHVLLITKEHYLDVEELPVDVLTDLMQVSQKVVKAIKEILR